MKKTCNCGAVTIDVDSDCVTVHCTNCSWYYTYRAIPRRLVQAVEQLVKLIVGRSNDSNEEETSS